MPLENDVKNGAIFDIVFHHRFHHHSFTIEKMSVAKRNGQPVIKRMVKPVIKRMAKRVVKPKLKPV
jgi:late competence protein required for DNA uptake (superfamily II DNA/RNA helicase)